MEFTSQLESNMDDDISPLSFAQQRLWFLDKLYPGQGIYNIPLAISLFGNIDERLLEDAFRHMLHRHEILRTSFDVVDDKPVQIIHKSFSFNLEIINLIEQEENSRQAEIESHRLQAAIYYFDLSTFPLIRAKLIKCRTDQFILLITIHHIIADGWSMAIFMRELSVYYNSFLDSATPKLPDLEIHYADYSLWQRDWLTEKVLSKQLDYWKNHLKEAPDVIHLPSDRLRPENPSYQGSCYYLTLQNDSMDKLKRLGEKNNCTFFMTLLTLFYAFLYRYSGQDDIVVGTPIANRNYPGVDNLIGFFVNTLALRIHCGDSPCFETLLARVRQAALNAYENQDIPFEQVVDAFQIKRELNKNPIFQVMFDYDQQTDEIDFSFNGADANMISLELPLSKFDLTFLVQNKKNNFELIIEYMTDLYDHATIARMAKHFECLANNIILSPAEPIDKIDILTSSEHQLMIYDWNNTQVNYPLDKTISQLFEEQVTKTPSQIAVIFQDQSLKYDALNAMANQLAWSIRSSGATAGTIIGIFCDRSIEFLIGILATFKAGAAYIPLDPSHPNLRVSQVIKQCRADIILTTHLFNVRLKDDIFHLLDDSLPQLININAEPTSTWATNLPVISKPDDPSYIIFTSGSTGTPKGAVVNIRGTVNHVLAMIDILNLTEQDVLAQSAPQGCDISVWQFITPLVCGGIVCIFPDEIIKDTALLLHAIEKYAITIYQIVPSQLRIILDEIYHMSQNKPNFQRLRWLVPGGEALPPSLCTDWFSFYDKVKLLNSYGPAECSDDVTTYVIDKPPAAHTLNMPIGKPLPNAKVYILNKALCPVPVSVLGELYVSGVGVGNGYLNDPVRTSEAFGLDPFTSGKLYKTGDIVKYLPDGNIVYIGRQDQQVKIRGHRIELADIESIINMHADVKESAVIVDVDYYKQNCLIAFIVPLNYQDIDNSERDIFTKKIRSWLLTQLPHYMIPNIFIMVEKFSLSENGKLNRKSLTGMIEVHEQPKEIYIAPRDDIEKNIALIWEDILRKNQISIDDNFFMLGGHSLSATQVMSRLCRTYKISIPLREFFSGPTIAELSNHVRAQSPQWTNQLKTNILPREKNVSVPLSYAQQRLWFLSKLITTYTLYISPLIFRLRGDVNLELLEKAFSALVARHEILRTVIAVDELHQPIQNILPEYYLKILCTEIKLSDTTPDVHIQNLIKSDLAQGFDLSQAPAIRVKAFMLGHQDCILLISMHHIISDGWSMPIFTRELGELYNSYQEMRPAILPDLKIQYADFAVWQRQSLQGERMEGLIAYWKNQLTDTPQSLQLPTDHARPKISTNQGAIYQFHLPQNLLIHLKKISTDNNVTLFMTLFGVYYTLLQRYSGQNDIIIGTPIANRNSTDIENLIGFFINLLPLRIKTEKEDHFISLLQKIKDVALNAYDHQDLPFDKLVEVLQVNRNLNQHPIFQVAFVLQNTEDSILSLNNIDITPVSAGFDTSRFDLTLFAEENNDQILLNFEYSTELFDERTIITMSNHLVSLAHELAHHVDKPIIHLNYLSVDDLVKLNKWNETSRNHDSGELIHRMFEQQVRKTPEKVALIHDNAFIDYQVLNEKANQLARYLIKNHITPGSLVGVSLERSFNMVISLLAIFKTGSAYLPLDPAYPKERLELMISIAKPTLIIAENLSINNLSDHLAGIINLDIEWDIIHKESDCNLENLIHLENVAYVIFTSGSTGIPKGVMMHHKGTLNRFHWMWEQYPFNDNDVCCQKTSLNFGDSVWEIFGPLLKGIKVVLISQKTLNDYKSLMAILNRHKVSRIVLVPSLLRSLLTNYSSEIVSLQHLKFWVVSGEALTSDLVKIFFNLFTQSKLLNLYGSSEVAADVTFYELQQPDGAKHIIPIGRPINNTKTYILDNSQQRLPIGVTGELYISGLGLSNGYIHQPELTSERFIQNPFDDGDYDRLYKTGDLARYRHDGDIEYLGRVDHQVKVRGYRIELGEIENCLHSFSEVRQAVVIVREDSENDQRIVAYVVPTELSNDTQTIHSKLYRLMGEKIPSFMIPNIFMLIEQFPMTPSGKIDRSKLPVPDQHTIKSNSYIAPRNAIEYQLAFLWGKVLNKKYISIYDNFFEIGGHSLLVIRLVIEINNSLNKNLSAMDVFLCPTIAEIAKIMHCNKTAKMQNLFLPVSEIGDEPPLFLIHPAGGLSFKFLSLVKYTNNYPIYAINNPHFGKQEGNFSSVEEMADFYLSAIIKQFPSGPYRLGGYSFGGLVATEIAYRLEKMGKNVDVVILIDSYHPSLFDPDEDPLIAHRNIKKHLLEEGLIQDTTEFNELFTEMLNSDKLSSDFVHKPSKAHLHLLKASIPNQYVKDDPYNGWLYSQENNIHVHPVAGEHNELFSQACIQQLANTIEKIIM